MRAALRVLLSLLLLASFAAWLVAIWSSDGRWGWTGTVLLLAQVLWPAVVEPEGRIGVCDCSPLDRITPETYVSANGGLAPTKYVPPPKPPKRKRSL